MMSWHSGNTLRMTSEKLVHHQKPDTQNVAQKRTQTDLSTVLHFWCLLLLSVYRPSMSDRCSKGRHQALVVSQRTSEMLWAEYIQWALARQE